MVSYPVGDPGARALGGVVEQVPSPTSSAYTVCASTGRVAPQSGIAAESCRRIGVTGGRNRHAWAPGGHSASGGLRGCLDPPGTSWKAVSAPLVARFSAQSWVRPGRWGRAPKYSPARARYVVASGGSLGAGEPFASGRHVLASVPSMRATRSVRPCRSLRTSPTSRRNSANVGAYFLPQRGHIRAQLGTGRAQVGAHGIQLAAQAHSPTTGSPAAARQARRPLRPPWRTASSARHSSAAPRRGGELQIDHGVNGSRPARCRPATIGGGPAAVRLVGHDRSQAGAPAIGPAAATGPLGQGPIPGKSVATYSGLRRKAALRTFVSCRSVYLKTSYATVYRYAFTRPSVP